MIATIKSIFFALKNMNLTIEKKRTMYANAQELINSAQNPLNIIEEYAALSPKRKVLLCDTLFIESKNDFQNMVRLLWPEARIKDMKKLEKFLFLIRKSAS